LCNKGRQAIDPFLLHVDRDDVMAVFGKRFRDREAEISKSNNDEAFHDYVLLVDVRGV